VVGTSTGRTAGGAGLGALDVLLTDDPDPDTPVGPVVGSDPAGGGEWICTGTSAREALEELASRVERHPQAAATLVQLLRLGRHADVSDALVAESLAYATLQSGEDHLRWLRAREGNPAPREALGEPPVQLERVGDELRVRFCRPEVHNAFGAASRDALVEALQLAAADDSVRRVHLSGEGRSFCSGGDLREFGSAPDPATAHLVRSTRSPGRLLHELRHRVVVELQGACIGAGIELAAFAGEVVARQDTRIQLPELDMGLVPGAGGTVSLPRRIGRRRTAWLGLSGQVVGAEGARRWGLVDAVAG
jgi:enoyl-CoA hydratase/carnithine racemase